MAHGSEGRRPFCSATSLAREEPLAATASRIDHWILIEYRGAWQRDVLGGSLLSPRLKAHLREQLALLRPSRLLFVKQPERRAEHGRRVFLATSTPGGASCAAALTSALFEEASRKLPEIASTRITLTSSIRSGSVVATACLCIQHRERPHSDRSRPPSLWPTFQFASRSRGARIATPFALATPTVIVAPACASSPNTLYEKRERCDSPAP